ncbi:MAG: sigma 54-interacting transcriptional regulator [Thiohalophilus sp.]|uniref:sigma-54 interaction domain-containing protein n=1 Tax=Thiohalophilus sp. TaxID=3028392 RepID=UPI002870975D|nr:sigma 54-interacting transcriptional regulator [Thiohalophilus sp.]MDR9435273.1 sigma 54-interacting transcriptional regulator [Thiohalophilus sp.]
MAQRRDVPTLLPSCKQLIDVFSEPFVIIGQDYRIQAANRHYLEQYRANEEHVVGNYCYKVSHHSDTPCRNHGEHCPLDEVFRTRRATHVIHVHYDSDGNEENVQLQATPILDGEGNVVAMGETINRLGSPDEAKRKLLGHSPVMVRLTEILQRVAPTQTTVLLQGESGAGKECVAEYIHHHSSRGEGPFVIVDSTTLGEHLAESELFGHERGAFTSADKRKQGLIESAHGGTLFIDEIGELSPNLQTKLLRLLETSQIRRVGATGFIDVDIRIIAATHRDLREMVQQKQFREDLYFRLTAFPIYIPPLRERKEDIIGLAEHFLAKIPDNRHKPPLSPQIQSHLLNYDYPGNVRELRNIIERAAIMARSESLSPEHFSFFHESAPQQQVLHKSVDNLVPHNNVLQRRRSDIDKQEILTVLKKHAGHRVSAARELGMSERTLYRHLQKIKSKPAIPE